MHYQLNQCYLFIRIVHWIVSTRTKNLTVTLSSIL